jgi:predicted cupin superfamily sugar epimerase
MPGDERSEGEQVARLLDLAPLPEEGGLFRRTFADAHSSAIYFLLLRPDFSALHTLTASETYHWYAGSSLHMLLLHDDGRLSEPTLGSDFGAGERPQLVVPAGTWQGSAPAGAWSLVGTTTAPPFGWSGFRLGERDDLIRRWPSASERITALTRS